MRNSLGILLVFCIGCGSGQPGGTPEYAYQAEADAVLVLAFGADQVLPGDDGATPAPDDRPKPGKCNVCNGTGKSGDGQGRCGTCGGDGRIDADDLLSPANPDLPPIPPREEPPAEVQPEPVIKEITLHVTTETAAGWPQEWWRTDAKTLTEQGWTINKPVRHETSDYPDAWFEVTHGDKSFEAVGPQPIEVFE